MPYFLKCNRRAELIVKLVELSMPALLVQELVHYQDNLDDVDRRMAFVVCALIERCRDLTATTMRGDDDRVRSLRAFIEADLAVFAAYMAEIRERDIPQDRFPWITKATVAALDVTGECKAEILAVIGRSGMLQ